jgi:uncharacterized protein involved in exopolysaccharide biosynthesis
VVNLLPGAAPTTTTNEPAPGILGTIQKYKTPFLAVLCTGLLLTAAYVLLTHKKYESDMSIMVQNARKASVITADATTMSQPIAAEVSEEDLNSVVEVLGSTDVLDEVADPGWQSAPSHTTEAQSAHEGKIYNLRKRMIIMPVRKSHVINVTYTSNDPKVSQETLSALLRQFIEKEKMLSQPGNVPQFFDKEAQRYKAQWEEAQRKLAAFQQEHGLISIPDKETEISKALDDALALQRASEAEVSEISQRINTEHAQLATTPQRVRTNQRTSQSAGALDQLNTQIAALTMKRAQLLTTYQPEDRTVKQLDTQIDQARAEVERMKSFSTSDESTDVNPTWQALDEAFTTDSARLKAVSGRKAVLDAQVASLQGQVKNLSGDALEFKNLQENAATLDANYLLYVQKRDSARMSAAMDNSGLLNFGVVEMPTFSISPVRPQPLRDSILGVVASLFLGLITVYLLNTMNQPVTIDGRLPEAGSKLATITSAQDLQAQRSSL